MKQGISLANFEIFSWLENLNPMFDAAYYATLNFLNNWFSCLNCD